MRTAIVAVAAVLAAVVGRGACDEGDGGEGRFIAEGDRTTFDHPLHPIGGEPVVGGRGGDGEEVGGGGGDGEVKARVDDGGGGGGSFDDSNLFSAALHGLDDAWGEDPREAARRGWMTEADEDANAAAPVEKAWRPPRDRGGGGKRGRKKAGSNRERRPAKQSAPRRAAQAARPKPPARPKPRVAARPNLNCKAAVNCKSVACRKIKCLHG